MTQRQGSSRLHFGVGRAWFHVLSIILICSLFIPTLPAGSPWPNKKFEVKSKEGDLLARSTPKRSWGDEGATEIFAVRGGRKKLDHQFDWYASGWLRLANTSKGISLVRSGGWSGGTRASEQITCFEFYLSGKLLKRYSTLDIAGSPDNVSASVSHHQVLRRVPGYRFDKETNRQEFVVETLDRRILRFDPETGELIQAGDKLEALRKSAWFQQQEDWVLKTDSGLETPRSVLVGHIEGAQPKAGGFVARAPYPVQVFSTSNPSNKIVSMIMYLRAAEMANDLPRNDELWAFSGFETNGIFFEVRSAIKVIEAEPTEEEPKK